MILEHHSPRGNAGASPRSSNSVADAGALTSLFAVV
jgi:hypothetical protein